MLADIRTIELVKPLNYPVYGIYDFSAVTNYLTLPHGLLAYLQETRRRDLRYAGVVVVVPKFSELLARSVIKITKAVHRNDISNIHLVNHFDDAIDYINMLVSESKETQ